MPFFVLLNGSVILSTLGLLITNIPVIIGGMIIAPLMWPIAKLAVGVLFSKKQLIFETLLVLFLAVVVGLVTSALITVASPIKFLNSEILQRTDPTLIDVVVALSAGAVAAFAMTHRKVSESLAGVAVAVSLMPPLSVSGIGLALNRTDILWGGFLLFSTNVLSILLACLVTFSFLGIRRPRFTGLSWLGVGAVMFALLLISIPLGQSLVRTVTQRSVYQLAQEVLNRELAEISPLLEVESIRTELPDTQLEQVVIEAEVFVPDTFSFTYDNQQTLVTSLERGLNQPVRLELKLQPLLSAQSIRNTQVEQEALALRTAFRVALAESLPDVKLRSLDVAFQEETGTWEIDAVLGSQPDNLVSELDRQQLEQSLQPSAQAEVKLNIEVTPLLELVSEPELQDQQVRQTISEFFEESPLTAEVLAVSQTESQITIKLELPLAEEVTTELRDQLVSQLQDQHQIQQEVRLELSRVEVLE